MPERMRLMTSGVSSFFGLTKRTLLSNASEPRRLNGDEARDSHSLVPIRKLLGDRNTVVHLVHLFDDGVELCGTESDSSGVEDTVGAAIEDQDDACEGRSKDAPTKDGHAASEA